MRLDPEFKDQYVHLKTVAKDSHKVSIDENGEPYIRGKRGNITPYANDGQVLCMYTDKPRILNRMVKLPWITRHQIADTEGYVKFHIKDFGKANRFLGLNRTYKSTERQLANLVKFKPKDT